MLKNKLDNFYIPRNKQGDGVVTKLLNFLVIGQYLIMGIVALCTLYELIRAIIIALLADSTSSGLMHFGLIKFGYFLSYVGVIYLVAFFTKLSVLGVFKSRSRQSITYERHAWLIVSAIACMLLGVILQLTSSEILSSMKAISLGPDATNTKQTWMLVAVLGICYIYVLGKVQEFREALKHAKLW